MKSNGSGSGGSAFIGATADVNLDDLVAPAHTDQVEEKVEDGDSEAEGEEKKKKKAKEEDAKGKVRSEAKRKGWFDRDADIAS